MTELAEKKIGATIVIARKTGLAGTIETGTAIDAKFNEKLIQSIFFPKAPLHDGAVILSGDRILAAGCLLPITASAKLDPPFGTRHRSGLAITMDTDCVVLLVSEERGKISLAENGKLITNLDRVELANELNVKDVLDKAIIHESETLKTNEDTNLKVKIALETKLTDELKDEGFVVNKK